MTEFWGFERPDGSVGVRNHLLVLTPMDCSYEPARKIATQVEGAVAVTQHHGCGYDEMVANALIGTCRNPNVAGVLLVGLGCESLTSEILAEGIRPTGKPVETLVIQEEGGTLKTMEKGVRILQSMAQDVAKLKREPFPLSKLTEMDKEAKVRKTKYGLCFPGCGVLTIQTEPNLPPIQGLGEVSAVAGRRTKLIWLC